MKTILLTMALTISILTEAQILTVKTDAVKVSFVADMYHTKGTLGGFKAKIIFDKNDLTKSKIEGSVDVNTIDTGKDKRDDHLKSKDFFEAEKYPKMTFKSMNITKEDEHYLMTGLLKIKDVEREEKIIFTFANNVFKGESTIQASNYNFGFQEKKPKKTDVKISFTVPVE